MERIETTAIRNLIHNEEYCRKVLPFIKEEYFIDRLEKLIFTEIYKFVNKYNNLPTKESLSIEMNTNKGVSEDEYKKMNEIISSLNPEPINLDWLVETTEVWCKDRAIQRHYLFHLTRKSGMIIYLNQKNDMIITIEKKNDLN